MSVFEWVKYRVRVLFLCVSAVFVSEALAEVKEGASEAPLTPEGERLEEYYTEMLASLRSELMELVPDLPREKRELFEAARAEEAAAKKALNEARKQMDELRTAKALVAHAKGKWIGGAERGIAAAQAQLEQATTEAMRDKAREELAKWRKNREDGVQALKERQEKLEYAERQRPAREEALKNAEKRLSNAERAALEAVANLGLDRLLSDASLDAKLAKALVLSEATPRRLAAFAGASRDQHDLIGKLLSADELLIEMAVADGPTGGDYGRAMEIYRDIWQRSDRVAEAPLRRLALAVSLEHAVPIRQRNALADRDAPSTVDPVERYLHYEKALIAGELDPAFKDLSVWEYRMVVNGEEPDEILSWGREMLRNYRPDHITTKDQRWRYVAIVRSDIRYGSQDNKHDKDELQFFQNILMNGGVCGRRAFFGRFMLRAFGIPTTARPSPGHAALARWTPDGWVVCLGGGWGAGWTKTRYDRDLDFLATTQARQLGEPFMKVKRARWIGELMGEERVFGLHSKKKPEFWHAVSLYTQKIENQKARTKALDAIGEDIGEANETKEKIEVSKVSLNDEDRRISVAANGEITIPAVATSSPSSSNGKILFMESSLGGKQLHYSRTGRHQDFAYEFDAPAAGRYALFARVVTPSWRQSVLLQVNDEDELLEVPLPHTVGMWETTAPVEIDLKSGRNRLKFSREGEVKGITIRDFTLQPIPRE